MRQYPVIEYSIGLVPLFLANATPNKACGVSYHRKPQAFPYKQVPMTLQWCCMEIISLCFERVTALGFLACHHMWRKMADGGAATVCTVFHVYSLIKCLYVRLCLWSVWTLIFFSCLLLFSCSGKCNEVNQKSMCRESCQISVGNIKQLLLFFLKMNTVCFQIMLIL